MLELQHITIKDSEEHLLLKDVSFCMDDRGFVGMYSEDALLLTALAQVLAGIQKPALGTIRYNGDYLMEFSEEERSLYRSTFAASLFSDFQILKNLSVYENITMGLEYPFEELKQELLHWGMFEKCNVLAEDLTFEEQMKMILLRVMIREPSLLIFHKASCPFSQQELTILYPLLEMISQRILVIVIGDRQSFLYANRTIEFEDGYIISDSIKEGQVFQQGVQGTVSFTLTRHHLDEIEETMQEHLRWKLRCLSILCVIMFICLSSAIFSTTLNVEEIEMGILKDHDLSVIAIEKQAKGLDDTLYERQYVTMQQEDIAVLQQNLKGTITLGYYPTNEKQAIYDTYGNVFSNYDKHTVNKSMLIEANSGEDLGLGTIIGEYPNYYHEVAISSSVASNYLKQLLVVDSIQDTQEYMQQLLGMQIFWYNQELTITGIFPEDKRNSNLEFQVSQYNDDEIISNTLREHSIYVKKGFIQQYPILKQQVYQESRKRIIHGNTVVNFDYLSPCDQRMTYYDGTYIQEDMDLEEDEVLVDFQMALEMGYRNTYLTSAENSNLSNFDRLQRYEQFADQWINKTITIQTYGIENAPRNSTIMNKKVKIKGFLLPISYSYVDYYARGTDHGGIYMKPYVLKPYRKDNVSIQKVYFHAKDEQHLRDALLYLRESPQYSALLSSSQILQFFVVDLKNLTTFLLLLGSVACLVFAWLLQHLLRSVTLRQRKEMTIYYLFGERKSLLMQLYKNFFTDVLKHQVLFGWLCGTLALAIFASMIYFLLSATRSVLFSLLLPLLLAILCFISVKVVFLLTLRKQDIIEESFIEK